jgi:hypothetical protein
LVVDAEIRNEGELPWPAVGREMREFLQQFRVSVGRRDRVARARNAAVPVRFLHERDASGRERCGASPDLGPRTHFPTPEKGDAR